MKIKKPFHLLAASVVPLLAFTAVTRPTLADQDTTISGSACEAVYGWQQADVWHWSSGIYNSTNQDRWVTCGLPLEYEFDPSYGYVVVNVYHNSNVETRCELQRIGADGTVKASVTGSASGSFARSMTLYAPETSPAFAYNDTMSVWCGVPQYSLIHTIYYAAY